MRRRHALRLVPASALSLLWPPFAASQGMARIAWVSPAPPSDSGLFLDALRLGLRELGYIEGRSITIAPYWADNSLPLLDQKVNEAIASNPQVIVTQGTAVFPAQRATRILPIIFGFSGDPVEGGVVQSLARPGGNLTGISYMTIELVGKRLQLLKETLPSLRHLAVVAFPQHPGDKSERRASETAAAALGLNMEYFEARGSNDVLAALSAIEKTRAEAVMAFPVQSVIAVRERVAEWSLRTRIPTASGWSQFVDGGNLMSYGPSLSAASHRLAHFVDRVLKGAKPADLPVEQPTRVELVINARTAKALGIQIPPSILLRADRVIE